MMPPNMSAGPDDRRRVAVAAKKTVSVNVRLTVLEARRLKVLAGQQDPPTVSNLLRELVTRELERPRSGPPAT
jgi:hypothetical protein